MEDEHLFSPAPCGEPRAVSLELLGLVPDAALVAIRSSCKGADALRIIKARQPSPQASHIRARCERVKFRVHLP
jgi:hypothetical protein